jgi:hypothetical protein
MGIKFDCHSYYKDCDHSYKPRSSPFLCDYRRYGEPIRQNKVSASWRQKSGEVFRSISTKAARLIRDSHGASVSDNESVAARASDSFQMLHHVLDCRDRIPPVRSGFRCMDRRIPVCT